MFSRRHLLCIVLLVLSILPQFSLFAHKDLDHLLLPNMGKRFLKSTSKDPNLVPRAVVTYLWDKDDQLFTTAIESAEKDMSLSDLLLLLSSTDNVADFQDHSRKVLHDLATDQGWSAYPNGPNSALATADALHISSLNNEDIPETRQEAVLSFLQYSMNNENSTLIDFIAGASSLPFFTVDIPEEYKSSIDHLPQMLSQYMLPDHLVALETDRSLVTVRSLYALHSVLNIVSDKLVCKSLMTKMASALRTASLYTPLSSDGAAWVSVAIKDGMLSPYVSSAFEPIPLPLVRGLMFNLSFALLVFASMTLFFPQFAAKKLKGWVFKLVPVLLVFSLYPITTVTIPFGGLVVLLGFGLIGFWSYRALSKLDTDAALICATSIAGSVLLLIVLLSRTAPLLLGREITVATVNIVVIIATIMVVFASVLVFKMKMKPVEAVDIAMAGWSFGIGGASLVFWLRPTFQILFISSLNNGSFPLVFGFSILFSLTFVFLVATISSSLVENKGRVPIAKQGKGKKRLKSVQKKPLKPKAKKQ
ncbi:hypothetical protein P9112_011525 [Eukaryota sp. TZLM1-RC]